MEPFDSCAPQLGAGRLAMAARGCQITDKFEVCFRSAGEAAEAEASWSIWKGGETYLATSMLRPRKTRAQQLQGGALIEALPRGSHEPA